jgi:hypothetical protein
LIALLTLIISYLIGHTLRAIPVCLADKLYIVFKYIYWRKKILYSIERKFQDILNEEMEIPNWLKDLLHNKYKALSNNIYIIKKFKNKKNK